MTQLWMLIYFQEHYKANKNLRSLSRIGQGEKRLRKMLRFLKEDTLMIDIRRKLTAAFSGDPSNDENIDILGQAVYILEEMLPWPRDRQCICGADLAEEFTCCEKRVNLDAHEPLLSPHYLIYCPACNESLSSASCDQCGRVYTWKLGTVETYKKDNNASPRTNFRIPQHRGITL